MTEGSAEEPHFPADITKVIVLDTETTGKGPDAEVVEVAWARVDLKVPQIPIIDKFEQLYKPSKRIEWGAMATHHIIPADLEGMPPSSEARIPDWAQYIVGHKVDYDWTVLGSPTGTRRICTLALSRSLWPDLDSHSLSAMVYALASDPARARESLTGSDRAHRAYNDVRATRWLLAKILEKIGSAGLQAVGLWKLSEAARIPDKLTFGRHKGTLIKDVPLDYISWLLRQPDLDRYLRKALEKYAE